MVEKLFSYHIVIVTWTTTMLRLSYSDVYTSSVKISDMVLNEENILNALQTEVANLGNETAVFVFSKFYQHRMQKVKELKNDEHLQGYLKHPNGIYLSIKEFATEYQNLRSALGTPLPSAVEIHLSGVADQKDMVGARLSIIRLQLVYHLNASKMIHGDYFEFKGPELDDLDAVEIGEAAFTEGHLDFAAEWLQEALTVANNKEVLVGIRSFDETASGTGRILALLGRTYLTQGHKAKAVELYKQAQNVDPVEINVLKLGDELISKPRHKTPINEDKDFKRLCQIQNKLITKKFDPRLKCFYREAILPYYRFKQELLSVSPYVTLFFDVISDHEGETIINISKKTLSRGIIHTNASRQVKESRTSDTSFVFDVDSPILSRLSKRVGAITDLATYPYMPNVSYAAEPFQVVNYGMGGHYTLHSDVFDEPTLRSQDFKMKSTMGGNRLATFLIYLTDVDRGGSTVFNMIDVAVSPVKKMALFWYNFKPSGEMDVNTRHAGCPVVFGHKWVTNKWIWQYGNTFTRRCGLTQDATQLDIDKYMRRGWN